MTDEHDPYGKKTKNGRIMGRPPKGTADVKVLRFAKRPSRPVGRPPGSGKSTLNIVDAFLGFRQPGYVKNIAAEYAASLPMGSEKRIEIETIKRRLTRTRAKIRELNEHEKSPPRAQRRISDIPPDF